MISKLAIITALVSTIGGLFYYNTLQDEKPIIFAFVGDSFTLGAGSANPTTDSYPV